ncbi:MAG: GNAT family N-acetyltransferase [Gammaproteobacteria bacterium]|nr:GNAT family N-acetyltransferase [Gammaproteobacteria bacterium]MYJ51725.1 GNAT family N-acetyltransferase [Gammaproteobacteria bacterium]
MSAVRPAIRRAESDDASVITEFNLGIALETENLKLRPETVRAGVAKLLDNPAFGFYLVAELDGQIVGSLMITTEWSDWRCGQFWWIQSVYVLPEFRKKGLYSRMYEKVKELARKNDNVYGFRLYVEKENFAAQAAYLKTGMRQTGYRMFEELKPGLSFSL